MKFSCPKCGTRIEATERFFGREVGCPTCGEMIHVPKPEEHTGTVAKVATEPVKEAAPSAKRPGTSPPAPADVPSRPAAGAPPPVILPGTVTAPSGAASVKRGGTGAGKLLLVFALGLASGYVLASHRKDVRDQGATASPDPAPTAVVSTPGASSATPEPENTASPSATPKPEVSATPEQTPVPEDTPSQATKPTPPPVDEPTLTPAPTAAPVATPTAEATPNRPKPVVSYFGSSEPPREEETPPPFPTSGTALPTTLNNPAQTQDTLFGRRATLKGTGTLRLTAPGDPLPGSVVNFASPDAWLVLEKVSASAASASLLPRLWINGVPAKLGTNVRVAQYGGGCAVVPQGPDFAAMQVFGGAGLSGASLPLQCGVKYNAESLKASEMPMGSFRLKRGYTATLAQEENGTGVSRNYVAQDHDLEVRELPPELVGKVRFVRIFPWRWVSKKGVAGDIHQNLKVGWYYDWNISHDSTPDLEYVPIRQNRWWPGLDQDWLARGANTLLGYNEPDHKDQANLSVDDAIHAWPELEGTGLRLGSPAVSDGGLGWLYDFMGKADAAHLRVDFVAVHYYRAVGNPNDAKGAATQMYNYLKEIHDRTRRPIWVTEWNNGANWTGHRPTYEQEKAAVAAMVEMLDRTPFVERYAVYNWVEDERNVQRKDGTLTPAGEVYRNDVAPLSYTQAGP